MSPASTKYPSSASSSISVSFEVFDEADVLPVHLALTISHGSSRSPSGAAMHVTFSTLP